MSSNTIVSGGKTYYRKWQYSDDGINFYIPGSPPSSASCATTGYVASRYYRVVYSYSSSSTDILDPSPWVHVILGPSSVADPTDISTTNISATGFTANWTSSATVCAGGGLGILHRIEVSSDPSFSTMLTGYPKDVTGCITNGATACSYDVTGLTTGITYYWRIKAMSYHVGTSNGDLYCGVNSNYVPTSANLPVELIGFTATRSGTGVALNWATASETNNDYFGVERSSNASNWIRLGMVMGAGNSNEIRQYTFTDTDPLNGTSYYRLRQTDFDGAFEFFGPVAVVCDASAGGFQVYPNPAGDMVYVAGRPDARVRISLCTISGKVLFSQSVEDLSRPVSVNLQEYPKGMYILKVESESNATHYKLIHQ